MEGRLQLSWVACSCPGSLAATWVDHNATYGICSALTLTGCHVSMLLYWVGGHDGEHEVQALFGAPNIATSVNWHQRHMHGL